MEGTPTNSEQPRPEHAPDPGTLDLALTGSLPCAWCGYELQGLSVRSVCPECGTAVRATVLYRVDPEAEELQPLRTPRLTSICLVCACAMALLAACCVWMLRLADAMGPSAAYTARVVPYAPWVVFGATAIAGVCMLGLIKPFAATPRKSCLLALVAVAAFVPLLIAFWNIHIVLDPMSLEPAYFGEEILMERASWRLLADGALIIIFISIRPTARELVRRSMALRTGRVDRQTLLLLAVVVSIAAMGDLLRIWAGINDPTPELSLLDPRNLMVILGSVFLTYGLGSAFIDSIRIGRAMLWPSPSITDVFGDPATDNDQPSTTMLRRPSDSAPS